MPTLRADDAAGVGANVPIAAETGIRRLSMEDRKARRLARALDKIKPNIVPVDRSDGYLIGNSDVKANIERLEVCADAGADSPLPSTSRRRLFSRRSLGKHSTETGQS
jgi:hypothetical protein